MGRPRLTIEQAFRSRKYRNILNLIQQSPRPLRLLHLRYALCKEHKLNLLDYPKLSDYFKSNEKIIKEFHKDKDIPPQELKRFEDIYKEYGSGDVLVRMKKIIPDFEKNKFNTVSALSMSLTRLIDIGLINKKKKGGNTSKT